MARTYSIVPWIELGNGLVSSATFLLAWAGAGATLPEAALTGLAAYTGYRLAFGTDATLEDLYAQVRGFDPAAAAAAMESGRTALERARKACDAIRASSQAPLLAAVIEDGERILEQLRDEPKRLPTAQKFLDVYLDGIATASEKYAHLRGRGESNAIRAQFQDLLTDAKAVCERQQRAMVEDDESDLDLDITVLRQRMALERQ
jgi:hypothetical protein